MNGRESSRVLGAGLLLGVLGDVLLRVNGAPGLNMLLFIIAVASMTMLLHHRSGRSLSGEAMALIAIGVLCGIGMAWRDAPALKVLSLGTAVIAFALPAFRAGAQWVRGATVGQYLIASARTAFHGAAGAAPALARVEWGALKETTATSGRWHRTTAVARGVALATPAVVVFGGLLIAADAVFAELVGTVVTVDPQQIVGHVAAIAFLSWVTTGYMTGFLRGTAPASLPALNARIGGVEAAVVLGILNNLFLVFVIVQARYLFGGGGLVEVTPGLTYAEYARRGFFELVVVVLMVVPMLLLLDHLVRHESVRMIRVFRGMAVLQVGLVLAIAASAAQRMRLYQAAYGLTEQRVYATALLGLLAFVMLLLTVTVLRGRPRNFAPGVLVASFVTLATLYGINPDALIARTNFARAATSTVPFDARYLGNLSADAAPVLLASLPSLPEPDRCGVAKRLLRNHGRPSPRRAWSLSKSRAEQLVGEQSAALASAAAACPDTRGNVAPAPPVPVTG